MKNQSGLFELRNPHSILAAVQQRPQAVKEVRISGKHPRGIWEQVTEAAGSQGIAITSARGRGPERRGRTTERQGAGSAMVAAPQPAELAGMIKSPREGDLIVALDCLQDPQNVGAVFRSASFFGARGLITTKDKSSPINATVCDIAAGGVDGVPFHVATNLARTLEKARDAGFWILGTSEHATQSVFEVDNRPWIIVIGNEQSGMRRLTQENCDEVCRLPPAGTVTSLNAAAAAASLLTALSRPR
ncbi:MAG: 23S rRNA (guanosine(2251)-2'-O)-methyltransferase RlmB [Planctomycetaceae bacterium]